MSALTFIVLLAPSWMAFAWLATKASWFWSHDSDLQFGWAVLVLCVFLFARTWATRPMVRLKWNVGNLSTGLLGCVLLFITQLHQAAYGLTPGRVESIGVKSQHSTFAFHCATALSKIDPPAGVRSLEIAIWGYTDVPHAEASLRRRWVRHGDAETRREGEAEGRGDAETGGLWGSRRTPNSMTIQVRNRE